MSALRCLGGGGLINGVPFNRPIRLCLPSFHPVLMVEAVGLGMLKRTSNMRFGKTPVASPPTISSLH